MSVLKYEKYICDVCGKEMPYIGSHRKCNIAIRVDFGNEDGKCRDSIHDYFDVCDDCMREIGFDPCPVFYKQERELKGNLTDNIKNIMKKIVFPLKRRLRDKED